MRLRTLSLVLGSILAMTAFAADKPVDVRDVMTATEFHSTGLDKLTPQEMAALNAWLAAYVQASAPAPAAAHAAAAVPAVAAPLPAPAATPAPVASTGIAGFGQEMITPEERGEVTRISSNIVGTFTGWTGNTLFKLANGQVWQQADGSTYETKLDNPPVVIKRLGLGYLLTLPGHNATVFVKRLQ
jgi:hypothetical protein